MDNWTPRTEAVNDIISTLQASITPNNQVQQQSYQRLQEFSQNPEFQKYLVYILGQIHSNHIGNETRQVAGLLLKKNIAVHYQHLPQEVKYHVHKNVLPVLADPDPHIRSAVGSIVTTIVSQVDLKDWPELIPTLGQLLDSHDVNAIHGSFNALAKICEDSGQMLVDSPLRPLNAVIPKLLNFLSHQDPTFRKNALECILHLLTIMPATLVTNMSLFLQALSHLTVDPSNEIRRLVCQCIVTLVEVAVQFLAPHMDSIIKFILSATQDPEEVVAIEACEFWSAFCEQSCFGELKPILAPHIPQIIPALLSRMVYSSEDIELYEADEQSQNENVPDRPEDVKPIFHKNRNDHAVNEEDEDDEYSDNEDEEVVGQWNLRKCAAAGLDTLSQSFGDEILPFLLPLLQDRFSSTGHWSIRESGILALGAVAEGCMSGITPHLPQLFPYLVHLVDDEAPLIRSIACWTLSRFAPWAVAQGDHDNILKPLMECLIRRILDKNKKVQEAACSAFCTLEEEANTELVPYLHPILQNLMFAFGKYQTKNLLILYDAIGTLADSVEDALNQPELIAVLMPPLITKWNALPDDSRELFPLLECLTSVAQALGVGFQDFAQPVLHRCLRLIENGIFTSALYDQSPNEIDPPDPEFIVCSLDLISGIVEGLKCSSINLIRNTNLPQLVLESAKDNIPDVRQSAIALVGDLSKNCVDVLAIYLKELLPVLIKNLDTRFPSVCNNSSWAIGELAIKVGVEIEPFVLDCMGRLIPMINREKLPRNIQENCAITIGRLGYVCPTVCGQLLPEFCKKWLIAIRHVRDITDREHCFLGLCAMVKCNPGGISQEFRSLCAAIASWDGEHYVASKELTDMFFQILHGYKQSLGGNWQQYFEAFSKDLRQFLTSHYNI